MKTQVLYKRLSLPLLLTVISATGIGVTPARSASLSGSQSTVINANPEATLIVYCEPGDPCDRPHPMRRNPVDEQSPTEKPEIEKPEIEKPEIEKPVIKKPNIKKPVIDKPNIENRVRHQQRELEQQQPTAEPSPQN